MKYIKICRWLPQYYRSKYSFIFAGAHTIGIGRCSTLNNRLYNFTRKGDTDPSLDPAYAAELKTKCKPGDTNTVVDMDPGSSKLFDSNYYSVVARRRGMFQSDAALPNDIQTRVCHSSGFNKMNHFRSWSCCRWWKWAKLESSLAAWVKLGQGVPL